MVKRLASWMPRLWSNWVSLLGAVLATVSGFTLVFGLMIRLGAPSSNVYADAILLLVVPGLFVMSLVLVPTGLLIERLRGKTTTDELGSVRDAFTELLSKKVVRRRLTVVAILSVANVAILGAAGQQAVHFMDSPEFCGTTCHEVMSPEYDAYLRSPHSRVTCVQCHIGPGASWAVKAKIDGLRQVWAVMTDTVERPIHAPVHELRPARETCEQCHWPTKFHGNRIHKSVTYDNDETNSAYLSVLLLKVGGENPKTGEYEGIHWHVSRDHEVRYEAHDDSRERIGKVVVLHNGMPIREYLAPEPKDDEEPLGAVVETRTMDCVDCHNRPTHQYDGAPEIAINWAFSTGLLDAQVPWLRKMALPLLAREDRARDDAEAEYLQELGAAYDADPQAEKPAPEVLAQAAAGLAELYNRNVYPKMSIGWDTYPTHIGHRGDSADLRGCFRCHDNRHKTQDGRVLKRSCSLCHTVMVDEEAVEDLTDEQRAFVE